MWKDFNCFQQKFWGTYKSTVSFVVVNYNVYLFLVITSDLISNNLSRTNKIYNDNHILFSLLYKKYHVYMYIYVCVCTYDLFSSCIVKK